MLLLIIKFISAVDLFLQQLNMLNLKKKEKEKRKKGGGRGVVNVCVCVCLVGYFDTKMVRVQ